MSDSQCKTCKFSRDASAIGPEFMACCRRAPSATMHEFTLDMLEVRPYSMPFPMLARFPIVQSDDWCGDWESKA